LRSHSIPALAPRFDGRQDGEEEAAR